MGGEADKERVSIAVLPGRLVIVRLGPEAAPPQLATGSFLSITRTENELSIVCAEEHATGFEQIEKGWRALRVAGPIPFTVTGLLASIASPLSAAGIPIFVVSTFDTDYILVKEERLEEAILALQAADFSIAG